MPVSIISVANRRALLAAIRDFMSPLGWTVQFDQVAAKGQLGLSKGVCHVVLGEERNSGDTLSVSTTRTDSINGGTVSDEVLRIALVTTINSSVTRYWGHTGGPTLATDTNARIVNDLTGPFNSVWLFADSVGSYCHVVVLSAPNRYTHFGFGFLDKLGMSHADVAYICCQQYVWWPNQANFAASGYGPNNPENISSVTPTPQLPWVPYTLFVPASVHNPTFGFGSGLIQAANIHWTYQLFNGRTAGAANTNVGSKMSEGILVTPDITTGGTPMWPLPVMQSDSAVAIHVYLGDLPDIRQVMMDNRAAGEVVTIGSDSWRLFPHKQLGAEANMFGNANPTATCNSGLFGYALKINP